MNCNILNIYILQSALLALATYASDSNDADRLRHLASPAGKVCSQFFVAVFMISCLINRFSEIFVLRSCRTNMRSGQLQTKEAFLKSWLNFHQQSPLSEYSLPQLPHACNLDSTLFHLLLGKQPLNSSIVHQGNHIIGDNGNGKVLVLPFMFLYICTSCC